MKFLTQIKLILLSIFVLGFSSACEKIDDSEKLELDLEIKVSNITETSANVDVFPSDEENMYYFGIAKKSEIQKFESDIEFLASEIEKIKTHENFNISRGEDSKYFDKLTASTEYVAYAVELDENLNVSEEVEFEEFTTKAKQEEEKLNWKGVKFDVKIENLASGNADLKVKSTDEKIPFFYDVLSEKVYEAYHISEQEGIDGYIRVLFQGLADKYEMTVQEVYDQLIAYNEATRNYTKLPASANMYAYAVGVAIENGVAVAKTPSTVYEFVTPEPQESDLEISFETLKEAPFSGRIEFIPSNNNEFYFYEFWEAENVEFYGLDDQGIIDHYVEHWGDYFDMLKVRGPQVYYREDMLQNTEYIALAFGIDAGAPCTKLFKHSFKTLAAITPEEQTFEIWTENEQAISVDIFYEPWDPMLSYAFEIIPKKDYDEAADKKAFLEEYYNRLIEYYMSITPFNREQAIEILSEEGSYKYECSFLEPGTEYYAWACAIDKDAKFLSEIALKEFTTTSMEYSDAKAIASIPEYFNGDELAAMEPDMWGGFAGKAIFSFSVETEGDVADWYVALMSGDITSKYEDSELYADLIAQGAKNPSEDDVFAAPFNTQFTLCSFAIDASGAYGSVHREVYKLTKSGTSPADDFIRVSPRGIEIRDISKVFTSPKLRIPYTQDEVVNNDPRENLRKRMLEVNLDKKQLITGRDLFNFSNQLINVQ